MKRIILILSFFILPLSYILAQDEAETQSVPVRAPFESGVLIDNQTVQIPTKGTLEFLIHHRFGIVDNGITDLFGIYAPGANVRLGLNYSLRDNLVVGFGTTKNKKMQDFQWKWLIFEQTRDYKFPVSLAYYGNFAIDGRSDDAFGISYKFANRFSFFNQLIFSHRINDMISIQVSPSYTHYNIADSVSDHDKIGVSFSGRVKISPQSSIMIQADIPLKIKGISEQLEFTNPSKPNFGIGWEISTSTHAFQIYAGSAAGILPQEIMMNNQNNFFDGDFMIGFTITRLWSF
ncbi:MAG: DUF5777 family beta-barrel protein [Bacteroidales bacterium]|jgi:hypothetical protein|nr:DUF5777 family beta-barrel protein [Bacteroidales bacterium]